ncbi:hypothetical protein ACFQX4_19640 [Roseomonas sp. GCM10028921]
MLVLGDRRASRRASCASSGFVAIYPSRLSVRFPVTVRTRSHRVRRLLRAALEERLDDVLRGVSSFDVARCQWLPEAVLARLGPAGGASSPQ